MSYLQEKLILAGWILLVDNLLDNPRYHVSHPYTVIPRVALHAVRQSIVHQAHVGKGSMILRRLYNLLWAGEHRRCLEGQGHLTRYVSNSYPYDLAARLLPLIPQADF